MKRITTLLIVVLITSLSYPAVTKAAVDEDEIGLFTKEEFATIPLTKIDDILTRFHEETPEKSIVLYVHGRKHHVVDEWKELQNIEKNFGVRVVMFHWPSWTSLISRPVDKAKNSADELAEVFESIRSYKEENPEIFAHKNISLLVHSMGNVVFREFVEKHYNHDFNAQDGTKLFNNFVSVGADTGLVDHKEWMSQIDFAQKKFVAMNNRDIVLLLSYLLDIQNKVPYFYKLGLGFSNFPIKPERFYKYLDERTTYIDLSFSLKSDHRYFQSDKPLMKQIFTPLANGFDFTPDKLQSKVKKSANLYYIIDD